MRFDSVFNRFAVAVIVSGVDDVKGNARIPVTSRRSVVYALQHNSGCVCMVLICFVSSVPDEMAPGGRQSACMPLDTATSLLACVIV